MTEKIAEIPEKQASISPTSPYAELLTAAPRGGRSLGHTSVVFEVVLATGERAVFKPASRRGPRRYKGEIAAYRFATALGIPNVPPALYRTFSYPAIATALGSELFTAEALAPDNRSRGAIMPWIATLAFLPLEAEPRFSRWRAELKKGAAVEDADLARQISTMVVFDWLTGNWDRWSGGNIGFSEADHRLLFVDNDGAFFETPPKDGLDRSKRYLDGVEKFSKGFVEHVRALDRDALEAAMGEEEPGAPLLSAKALDGVDARRQIFLQLVDEKGPEALAFP